MHAPFNFFTYRVFAFHGNILGRHIVEHVCDGKDYRAVQCDLALRFLHFDMYYSQHYITWRSFKNHPAISGVSCKSD